MTFEETLRAIVREELERAIGAARAPAPVAPPSLLDRRALARELGASVAKIDRLCRDGLPFVRLGETKRFDLAKVRAWLEARAPSGGAVAGEAARAALAKRRSTCGRRSAA